MDQVDESRMLFIAEGIIDGANEAIRNGVPIDKAKIIKSPNNNEGIQAKILSEWDRHSWPKFTQSSFHSWISSAIQERKVILQERRRNAQAINMPPEDIEALQMETYERLKEKTIEEQGKLLGFNPYSGEYDVLLVNKHEVSLRFYEHYIKKYGKSDSIALPSTIVKLLEEAENKGLSRKQTADLFSAFALKYYPDIKVAVEGVKEDEDGRFCRAWTEVLGLPDGGFMVRYRFHQPCQQVFKLLKRESILS